MAKKPRPRFTRGLMTEEQERMIAGFEKNLAIPAGLPAGLSEKEAAIYFAILQHKIVEGKVNGNTEAPG